MISAVQALQLTCAQLLEDEEAGVEHLLAEIDVVVRANMKRSGCQISVNEKRANVIVETSNRLKSLGFVTQWAPVQDKGIITNEPVLGGFMLLLSASDEAFREARQIELSATEKL